MNLLLVISTIFFHLATAEYSSKKIINGTNISIKEAPFQIALLVNGRLHCGGVLLSVEFALTAGHCVPCNECSIRNYLVVAGTSNCMNKNAARAAIEWFKRHPNYTFNEYISPQMVDFDYALLKLGNFNKIPTFAQFIKLPGPDDVLIDGEEVFTYGWGMTESGIFSPTLRGVTLEVYNFEKCSEAYKDVVLMTERMLCAGYEDGIFDSCAGRL